MCIICILTVLQKIYRAELTPYIEEHDNAIDMLHGGEVPDVVTGLED